MIVVDASVVIEVLLRTDNAPTIDAWILADRESLFAPHVLDLEVAQVLRRYYLGGEITNERGATALADLASLPIERYPHALFLGRIWALRDNVTAYDAAYLALAEALGAPLATLDLRLAAVAAATTEVIVP